MLCPKIFTNAKANKTKNSAFSFSPSISALPDLPISFLVCIHNHKSPSSLLFQIVIIFSNHTPFCRLVRRLVQVVHVNATKAASSEVQILARRLGSEIAKFGTVGAAAFVISTELLDVLRADRAQP